MKRLLLAFVLLLSCVLSCILNTNFANAGTQDFIISNFHADYYLSLDKEGRSSLKTVESITAVFPNYDQNHGIERALPKAYDGHPVSLKVQSVNDENGASQNFSEYTSNGNQVIRIGDADEYVHGAKTYVITYTQRDVTKYFADTDDDEFYWDVNGVGWGQAFSQVSAAVHIDASLSGKVSGKQACYYGASGSTQTCGIFMNDDKTLVTATTSNLSPGENMTIAIGFTPHTFGAYQMTQTERFLEQVSMPLAIVCYVLLVIIIILRVALYRNAPRRKAIIAQYVPPVGIDLSTSASILKKSGRIFQTAIISMAVKNNVKITEKITDLIFGIKIRKYNIELLSTAGMGPCENEVAMMLFGAGLNPGKGSSVDFPKTDIALAQKVSKYVSAIKRDLREDSYLANKKNTLVAIILFSILLAALSIFVSAIIAYSHPLLATELFLMPLICTAVTISSISKKPLNEKGRELYDYLLGLKLFIKTAEKDRIKLLQSPNGAERISIDTKDSAAVLKLYEKLLPYAVMFGLEKEWSKVLAVYYDNCNMAPAWYLGANGFDSSSFCSSLSSFSSSIGSSSSTGGSGGGGSSGGGGGGGGGGGW